MNTEILAPTSAEPPDERALDLARWLGRREAFGTIAGRCSGADVECLRQIRNRKLFRTRARNWDEFGKKELRLSRRKIDDDIRHLEEFGPPFFQVAQLTRITPQQYRAIAPHVAGDGINLDGQVIALVESNAGQVTAAVQELCRRVEPRPVQAVNATVESKSGPAVDKADEALPRCDSAAEALEGKPILDGLHRAKVARSLRRLLNAAARLAVYAAR
ncbi:MAG: hypothetical protein ACLQU1_25970 [Bryobacteraceae bacterium]